MAKREETRCGFLRQQWPGDACGVWNASTYDQEDRGERDSSQPVALIIAESSCLDPISWRRAVPHWHAEPR